MKKLVTAAICITMSAILLAGCSGGRGKKTDADDEAAKARLVGEWEQISEDGSPSLPEMGIPSGYIFEQDNTGLDTFWDLSFRYTVSGDTIHIAYDDSIADETDYEYTIKDGVLTMTRTNDDAIAMVYKKLPEEDKLPEESN